MKRGNKERMSIKERCGLALLFWWSVFELITGTAGWWGLSWIGRSRWHMAASLPLSWSLATLRQTGRPNWGLLLAMLLPALLLHLLGSNLRHWKLNPMRSLEPNSYPDRTIERIDIPLDEGYVPALYITPKGETQAALCVVHGSGCNKSFYIWRLVDALIGRGFALLLIDLDGHGESPRIQRYPEMLECIVGPVEWLRRRYQQVGLIGYSLGACLAGRAVADGLQVDGVALLQGPPKLIFSERDRWREALLLTRPSMYHLSSDASLYHIIRAWKSWPIRAAISTWDLIDKLDLCSSVQRIRGPLLVAYGGKDAIVPLYQGEQIRAVLPPQATWRVIKRASHLSLILEPEMLRILADWFSEEFAYLR